MAASKRQSKENDSIIYQEFGSTPEALERAPLELPPSQHQLKIQASRKGRGGKTVTVISGFQVKIETLEALLKQLKTQCGAGGTIKEDTLEIQGAHQQKLLEILTKLGYKAKISGG